jgi:single-strand DNA-binding protein
MAYVRVEQRNAHLAAPVQLAFVNGREGKVAKAVLTAISNTRRGSGEAREDEPTAIQWTLWGKQAENAHEYLGKGSHVNVVGRVQNNNYEKDGTTVYAMAFTAEEIDYLDSKAQADARRARGDNGGENGDEVGGGKPAAAAKPVNGKANRGRQPARADAKAGADADIPF